MHERKLPLEFVGARQLRGLTPGTVVVAFSRKAVLALAGEVNRLHPGRVAVLYGAMPLASRREEIDRFLHGGADVCVATDVLGHGVNLPCETLLFAETTKFDGEQRRDLLPWELAQIAGRAGRFGLVERGHVGVLVGLSWGNADPELVEDALTPHVPLPEGHFGYRIVDEARIGPRLGDLGVENPRDLDAALAAWHRVATREWAHEHWLAVESLQPIRGRLAVVERHLRERGRQLGLEDTWKLANAPIDPDGAEILGVLALAVAGDRDQRHLLQFLLEPGRLRDSSLEEAEEAGRVASMLRWFALQYPGVGGVTIEKAAALERAAAERVVRRLAVEVRDGKARTLSLVRAELPAVVPAVRSLCPLRQALSQALNASRAACTVTGRSCRFGTKPAQTRDGILDTVTTGHRGCPWGWLWRSSGRPCLSGTAARRRS